VKTKKKQQKTRGGGSGVRKKRYIPVYKKKAARCKVIKSREEKTEGRGKKSPRPTQEKNVRRPACKSNADQKGEKKKNHHTKKKSIH